MGTVCLESPAAYLGAGSCPRRTPVVSPVKTMMLTMTHIVEDVHDHLQELAVVLLCDDELVNVLLPVISTVEMKVKGFLRNRMNPLVQE